MALVDGRTIQTSARGLSQRGRTVVEKFFFIPFFNEYSLHPYHPLAREVREKVQSDELRNLRDIEKRITRLAPVSGPELRNCQHS